MKDASTLAAGDELIFVFNVANPPVAMGPQRTDYNNFGYTEVSYPEGITDKSILNVSSGNVTAAILEGSSSGWYFHTNEGYLCATSSSKNYLETVSSQKDNAKATINISNAGDATITFSGSYTHNLLKYTR